MLATILACVISAVAAIGVYILVTNVIFKKSLKKKREAILKEAEAEGEVIKKEKILQAKEKFIQLKSDHDRAVNERNQKLNQREQGIWGSSSRNSNAGCARTTSSKSRWRATLPCWNGGRRRPTG